jgi:hypothetical protein
MYPFALVLTVPAPAAEAHHSIAGNYDRSRQTTVEGFVSEFRFVNPHPILVIEAMSAEAARETWLLEMDNRFELQEIGVTSATFRRGDRVVATGSLGRKDPHSLYLRRLDRPADGLRYEQVGYRPRISAPPPEAGRE